MKFYVLTLFPEMIQQGLGISILGRAVQGGQIGIEAINIRDFTQNKHGRVDDYTYGGGAGMLMQAQPVYDAWKTAVNMAGPDKKIRTVYLTPQGKTFTQQMAEEFAREEELIFLCGHYEGIDERVLEETVTDYVSIGDYVLTGGELPAMVMIDAIARLVPGVLHNDMSAETESFHGSLLEYPQYSRPEVWQGKSVPGVLLSGDHKKIRQWRLEQSVSRTKERRPDLYTEYERAQKCRERLLREKLLHIDMTELLARGQAQILFDGPEGIFLKDRVSGVCMATAEDEKGGRRMLELVCAVGSDLASGDFTVVSHKEFLNHILAEMFDMKVYSSCYQAVYTRKEPLPPVHLPIEIKALEQENLDAVVSTYQLGDAAYIQERIRKGCMFGAFAGGELAGYIGVHGEGSIGMLYVFPKFRRQGIGKALETYMINRFLEKSWVPYGQVIETNEESLKMQERVGLYFSKTKIYWIGK
ncbi:MAG: tRNA (guanosine(37)-N1)-methyltransferase TrmD [Lachnospiraceae bacterium]|nr:tRNA (guanosine(37)-N1)-methyltransferase TrmD [Lachnospiraceae bacterium]